MPPSDLAAACRDDQQSNNETGLFEPNPRHACGQYCEMVSCCFIDGPDGSFDKNTIGLPRMVFVLSDIVAVARKCAVIYCQLLACCNGDPSGATIHATICEPCSSSRFLTWVGVVRAAAESSTKGEKTSCQTQQPSNVS
jgi:hypothetical protein